MQNEIIFLQQRYNINSFQNEIPIQIALFNYSEIFNAFDPSPYSRRDLNPDLLKYLDDCSNEIPLKFPIKIQFSVSENRNNEENENGIKTGIKSYFTFETNLAKRKYQKFLLQILINILISLSFLSVAISLEIFIEHNFFSLILITFMTVGGWVFLWRGISMFAFERKSYKNSYLKFERLMKANIHFNHIK